MPIDRDDTDERLARIDMLLEELRVNTEALTDIAKREVERAAKASRDAKDTATASRAKRARRKKLR